MIGRYTGLTFRLLGPRTHAKFIGGVNTWSREHGAILVNRPHQEIAPFAIGHRPRLQIKQQIVIATRNGLDIVRLLSIPAEFHLAAGHRW